MPSLALTFAEIDCLLDGESRIRIHDLLHLPDSVEAATSAGLASLCARGLALLDSGTVRVRPDVQTAVALLTLCDRWLDLLHVASDSARSLFVGAAGNFDPGVIVTAVAPGTFQIDILDQALSPRERFESVMGGLLDNATPVILYVQNRNTSSRAAIARTDQGEWQYAIFGKASRFSPISREEALTKCADHFNQVFGLAA